MMMNNNNNLLISLIVLPLLAGVSASKDSNYYPGWKNPNEKYDMYWQDSINVLQDLSQFSALFVEYHGCV